MQFRYSHIDRDFRCQLLTGYSQPDGSWNDDVAPLSESILGGPPCELYDRRQGIEM